MACGQAVLGELNKIYDPKVYPYPADLGNFSQAYWKLVRYQTDTVPGASPPRENLCTGCILSMFSPRESPPRENLLPERIFAQGPGTQVIRPVNALSFSQFTCVPNLCTRLN